MFTITSSGKPDRTVSVGWQHQCGISESGLAYCWGANEAGQLGDGTLRSTTDITPVRTRGITPIRGRLLDVRETVIRLLAHGGLGLLIAVGLVLGRREWVASRPPLHLVALWVGAVLF